MNNKEVVGNFKAAYVAEQFSRAIETFTRLLAQLNTPEISAIQKKLHEELKQYQEQGFLTVAFVGQYSAGKSTIISALTGLRDIRIGADITTDKTASYDWNGIKLIDTPGLFTDRKDHDEITYEAIRQSDLLVFCLTYMLFDSVTAENFKKLAYELGYRWKTMLVVNKMADGAGEEEELIANYCQSLAAAIQPYTLDEFPLCFIDAKDYCEGVDEKDEFLIEVSRFQTFTDALNAFTKRRASLAKFDTPIRIALGSVDDAQLSLTRNSNEDAAFFELLNRLSRTVRQERDRLRTKVRGIALRLSAAIANEGTVPTGAVGGNEDIEALVKQAENNVEKHCQKGEVETEEAVKAAIKSIQKEIKEVLQSDLAQAFVTRLEVNQKISAQNVKSKVDVERLRNQVHSIKRLGEHLGESLIKSATKPGENPAGRAFLRAGDVAGGNLHQQIYGVGKFLGFKFKPYGAVNIAKGIGNAAKFLGPLLSVGALAMDFHAKNQEDELLKKQAEARRDITSQFIKMARDLETQVEAQLREVEAQLYGEIEKQIAEARQQEESAIASSNTSVKQLIEIRKDFELILGYITKATQSPVV